MMMVIVVIHTLSSLQPGTVLQKVTPGQTAVSVTTAMSLAQSGRSIVVNTAGAGMTQSYQTINKRVGQAVASAAASNAQLLGTPITVRLRLRYTTLFVKFNEH